MHIKIQVNMNVLLALLCIEKAAMGAVSHLYRLGLTEFPAQENITADLISLDASYNEIQYIPEDGLCHVTGLKALTIYNNKFSAIGNISCIGETLTELYAGYNPLKVIPAEALESLTTLKILHLQSAQLVAFPELLHVRATLIDLSLQTNPGLSGNLPEDELANLTSLTKLKINNVGLTQFPSMPEMPILQYLYLGNEHTECNQPIILASFPKLTQLQITSAQLTKFPVFSDRPILALLSLSHNKFIPTGPEDFQQFPRIQALSLSFCGLTAVPNFSYISEDLKELYLDHNPLKTISRELLMGLPHLRRLTLLYTDLLEMPCLHMTLERLDVYSTGLEELPCIGSNTKVLNLDRNPIKRIEVRHAVVMKSITTLYLKYISSLDEVADYMDLQHSNYLDLTGSNPNLCKC